MVADIFVSSQSTVHPKLREHVPSLVFLLGILIVYAAMRGLVLSISDSTPLACLAMDVSAVAVAGLFYGIQYSEIPALLRILVRGLGIVLLIQVAFDGSTLFYAADNITTGASGKFFIIGTMIGLAAGLQALWRPSFMLPLAIHYIAFRYQFNVANDIPVSETDYRSMLDIGLFVTIGAVATGILSRSDVVSRLHMNAADSAHLKETAAKVIWACAVGAHLGNYLISGWTKVKMGGGDPFFWVAHNPTQTSILIGLERGDNPLAAWPALVQLVWTGIIKAGPILNFVVLGTQIASPVAVSHRRVLMTFTIMFDIFHIGVYFTLGALFHFWIIMNVLIYLSARRFSDREFTAPMKAVALGAMLVGHNIFYTSHLGWLDGAKLASPQFEAETADGRRIPIPSVYFGLLSYSIAQTAMFIPDQNFQMRLGGNTYNPTDWKDSQSCGADIRLHQDGGVTLKTIEDRVRETDMAMRRHPLVKTDNLYYFYPSHMVANPFVFEDFNRLTMGDIVRYHYIVDSVCLSLDQGRLIRNVRKHTDYAINVKN